MIKRREKVLLLVITAVILFLLAGAVLQIRTGDNTVFPQTLGDMELKLYQDGVAAKKEIARLHFSR